MKKKKLVWIFIITLILSVFGGLNLNPPMVSAADYPSVYVNPAINMNYTPPELLYVDAFNLNVSDWTTNGTSPFLDANDTSMIYTSSDEDLIGNFTFSNLTNPGTPTSVSLDVLVMQEDAGEWLKAEIWNGSDWSLMHEYKPLNTVFTWETWNVTSILDTSDKINSAEVRFTYDKAGSSQLVYVDAARLNVTAAVGVGSNYIASTVQFKLQSGHFARYRR